jgi:hypothetical protein
MSIEKKFDYSGIPTVEVARILFGAEDRTRSKPNEVRFPDLGGLTVHPVKNKWFCHTEGVGGDAIALVRHLNKCEYGEAFDWLRAHGFEKISMSGRRRRRSWRRTITLTSTAPSPITSIGSTIKASASGGRLMASASTACGLACMSMPGQGNGGRSGMRRGRSLWCASFPRPLQFPIGCLN